MAGVKPEAEIRPILHSEKEFERGLRWMVELASQDLIALFIVADEEAVGLPTPEAWQRPGMEMSERDRRWRKRWR